MKRIDVNYKGTIHYSLIDNEDYELVKLFKWNFIPIVNGYARSDLFIHKKKYQIYMHRLIMNAPKGLSVDHINCNGLDNRKENLRICTHAQNIMNQRPQNRKSSSKYKGVSWIKPNGKWEAYIKINQKKIGLGYFHNEIDAAKAYNERAEELFGEFANINKF